jgi:hypothetical protein
LEEILCVHSRHSIVSSPLIQGPNVSDVIVNGTPVKAVAGQKVSQVMAAARVKINYR